MNEVSIAQSIISQALPALSPRLNLAFSPKSSDRTRLVDPNLELGNIQANVTQLESTITPEAETEIQTPKNDPKNIENKVQNVTPSKWPAKPGVLVHVNSNHTLSPKNQARLQIEKKEENEANLGLLERNRTSNRTEYSKKNGKPRRQGVVSGIFKNLKKDSDDDESGKYKKINKSNKRAMSLINVNKTGYVLQKSRLRSLFQSDTPNVIVTEGGSCHLLFNLNKIKILYSPLKV